MCLASIQMKLSESKSIGIADEQPRIFFRQVLDATGFFPIEINVPDTISTMMSGLGAMYDTVSSYFGSGSGESEGQTEGEQSQQIIHDENNSNSKMTQMKKKVRRKSANDYDYVFNYFLLL